MCHTVGGSGRAWELSEPRARPLFRGNNASTTQNDPSAPTDLTKALIKSDPEQVSGDQNLPDPEWRDEIAKHHFQRVEIDASRQRRRLLVGDGDADCPVAGAPMMLILASPSASTGKPAGPINRQLNRAPRKCPPRQQRKTAAGCQCFFRCSGIVGLIAATIHLYAVSHVAPRGLRAAPYVAPCDLGVAPDAAPCGVCAAPGAAPCGVCAAPDAAQCRSADQLQGRPAEQPVPQHLRPQHLTP